MKAYSYDDTTKKYKGEVDRQRDPLESKAAGHDVWLMPANATLIEPLEEKEGFDIVWHDDHWEYEEVKKDPEPEPYVPTELDKKRQELWETEQWLRDHDYIGTKIATGRATIEDYADEIAQMSVCAEKVDALKAEIAELESAQ